MPCHVAITPMRERTCAMSALISTCVIVGHAMPLLAMMLDELFRHRPPFCHAADTLMPARALPFTLQRMAERCALLMIALLDAAHWSPRHFRCSLRFR